MRYVTKILPVAAALLLLLAFGLRAPTDSRGYGDLGTLLNNVARRDIKTISVPQLAALLKDRNSRVIVFDANPHDTDLGETYGVIPGAYLLSNVALNEYSAKAVFETHGVGYDPTTELPSDKSAKLVFYCYSRL